MAATWLVRTDPTPTPRTAKRANTRIIPGATAGIWRTKSLNDPPRAARVRPPPMRVAASITTARADAHQGRGDQLGSHELGAARGDEERGGDGLVPELGGDTQHAEQQGEQVGREPGPDEVAELLHGVGTM